VDGIILRGGEGEEVATQPDRSVLVKLDLEQIGMTESWYGSRQPGAAPHLHERHADSFYVLDGEVTFFTATGSRQAPAGAVFLAPPRVVHGFSHERDEETRFLNFHTPGEQFVESLRARRDADSYDPTQYDSFDPRPDAPSGATISLRGDGDRLEAETRTATVKVDRTEIALVEFDLDPGFEGPKPHIHKRHVDSFYVLEGEPEFRAGDTTLRGSPGMLVAAPPGVVHAFGNPGPRPARLINVHAPGCDFREYLHVMQDVELDDELRAKYDVYEV
jgi:quercetin dioxygenase-like cupin family protein